MFPKLAQADRNHSGVGVIMSGAFAERYEKAGLFSVS